MLNFQFNDFVLGGIQIAWRMRSSAVSAHFKKEKKIEPSIQQNVHSFLLGML